VALSCRRLAGFSQNSGIYWAISESCNFEKPLTAVIVSLGGASYSSASAKDPEHRRE
jgi:hypothetical protein